MSAPSALTVWAPDGVPDVAAGDDLAALFLDALDASSPALEDGDIVAVTSKVVAKAEGMLRRGAPKEDLLAGETVALVARRGHTTIVRNRLGLVMANAGIDGSNVEPGAFLLLPRDPDASARAFRDAVRRRTSTHGAGVNVGVIVTDTSGRAWREGQTDICIGAAGVVVLDPHQGRLDAYGNPLLVTAPAVGDELAGAAELVAGKLSQRPFVVIRGRADLVLPPGDHGTGAGALVRPVEQDLFSQGLIE